MARSKRCRRIADLPGATLFKPAGVPARSLVEIVLTVDEFEALRLADYEGLYREQAAQRMGISRPTFGPIVKAARPVAVTSSAWLNRRRRARTGGRQ
jgi:uncharacterized protein